MTVSAIRSNGRIIESFEIAKPIQINGMQLLLLENWSLNFTALHN
jgi:hypothetical protein